MILPLGEDSAWIVLRTKLKQENLAAATLRKLENVEVCLPKIRFQKKTKRGVMTVTEPLFPNYLFARFPFEANYKQVSYCLGVASILQFGNQVAQISDARLNDIKSRCLEDEILEAPQKAIEIGDEVEILEGSLKGTKGVIAEVLDGDERVRMLFDFLGQSVDAKFQINDLFLVEKRSARESVLKNHE